VVRLAFDFARAEAQLTAGQGAAGAADAGNPESSRYQALLQLSAKLDKQVQESRAELQALRQKLQTAPESRRKALEASIAEVQSEVDLADARRDTLHSMAEFVSGTTASGLGASGLRAQIEGLARTLPPELAKPLGSEAAGNYSPAEPARTAPLAARSEPTGLWALTADLFTLMEKIRAVDEAGRLTDALAQTSGQLRAPLVNQLKDLSRQGDVLAREADTAGPSELVQQKKELNVLTQQFRQTSAAFLPLSKQGILLDLYKRNLSGWRSTIKNEYHTELRSLLLRIAVLLVVLLVVFGLAELWRRAIFRYIQDPRRRYQLLLVRKIALWFSILLVIAFAFASQLGSVITFAGLLTAGVAVALQNVILSVAGYFFLIGKFGIRVGDRVQIAGVTGEVVEIGLVRLHIMELSGVGADAPTGRVVAFSNSIVFQPSAGLFKQIPGTSFGWHEIALTLSADSDYRTAEERMREVAEKVFADYREDMEKQHRHMERTLSYTQVSALRPKSRVRFTSTGLEVTIRFPVDLHRAGEIDDRVTRELLDSLNREPKLTLVSSGTPIIRLTTDLTAAKAT
ncbi:MAG TPA: mechanosensitive ion channel domain-containing protein, partial [Terriglobales bacterium]|nr:mechanosensitive ion channel domain-containing protein [Terriglobales bacterium]